jgi:hypothetical protein
MTLDFNRSKSLLAMDAYFGTDNLEGPFQDTMGSDFCSAMELDGPEIAPMTETEVQDNNDLIDDLLLSLDDSLDKSPDSPFCDILSIPSPTGQYSPTYVPDIPSDADAFMDQFFEPQPTRTKFEPRPLHVIETSLKTEITDSKPVSIPYNKIQELGKLHQAQQVIVINDAGEETVYSISGNLDLAKTILPSPEIKTEKSPESPIYVPPHAKKAKKEQNKKASQKYRQKKKEKEENMQANLEQLKKDKVAKEKELSKIQGKNEYLLESIERKFAHLL